MVALFMLTYATLISHLTAAPITAIDEDNKGWSNYALPFAGSEVSEVSSIITLLVIALILEILNLALIMIVMCTCGCIILKASG
ncbi:hypothetical protein DdX_09279 [Ditylenchus destructor]|uniref:NADH dehydrogenase subunit 4L n=1 Tax=Ditylenchus destructor TaxID=166010 RepID=A0AAD4N4A2_9BILA|nr:hypothetical protein DdX_09279 [Ditylenchus destructor]